MNRYILFLFPKSILNGMNRYPLSILKAIINEIFSVNRHIL